MKLFWQSGEIEKLHEEIACLRNELRDIRSSTVIYEDITGNPLVDMASMYNHRQKVPLNAVIRALLRRNGLTVNRVTKHEYVALEPLGEAQDGRGEKTA